MESDLASLVAELRAARPDLGEQLPSPGDIAGWWQDCGDGEFGEPAARSIVVGVCAGALALDGYMLRFNSQHRWEVLSMAPGMNRRWLFDSGTDFLTALVRAAIALAQEKPHAQ